MKVAFCGNFRVSYTTESHHALSLEALGHTVIRLQESEATTEQIHAVAKDSDLFVWVHTHGWPHRGGLTMKQVLDKLRAAGVLSLGWHLDLYMPLQKRWKAYQNSEYLTALDWFVTVDREMAAWINENRTTTRALWKRPGVYHGDCELRMPAKPFDVAFVGSGKYHPEWPHRGMLLGHLKQRYGKRFRHYGTGAEYGHVRGKELNQVYADARVVVGDSLCPRFAYNGLYWSDRVPETLGRGGTLLMPRVPGMDQWYKDREHLAYWDFGEFGQLDILIHEYLNHGAERQKMRQAGQALVANRDTYQHLWAEVLTEIGKPRGRL